MTYSPAKYIAHTNAAFFFNHLSVRKPIDSSFQVANPSSISKYEGRFALPKAGKPVLKPL